MGLWLFKDLLLFAEIGRTALYWGFYPSCFPQSALQSGQGQILPGKTAQVFPLHPNMHELKEIVPTSHLLEGYHDYSHNGHYHNELKKAKQVIMQIWISCNL